MSKTKKTIIAVLFVLTIIVAALGSTYAYFTATITGNDTASRIRTYSGKLALDFQTSQYINNLSGELIQDSQRATQADQSIFSVYHLASSTADASYTLTLSDISISDNLKSADFKWELVKNGTVINSGNFANIGTSTTMTITPANQTLTLGNTDNYVFRLWLSETQADQSSLYDGTFSAKISIDARGV